MPNTFDPGKLLVTFGVLILKGWAEGDMVTIEKLGPGDRLVVGSGGETARVRSRDKSYRVKCRLLDTSPINDALSLLVTVANNPELPLSCTDPDRPRTFICPDAFIEDKPGVTYSNNVAVREWAFICPTGDFVP